VFTHRLWHVLVLASTLLAAAGAGLLALSPLVFEDPPPGLTKARPFVVGLVVFAFLLFLVEWLVIH
jgi:hypothetical protein